MASANTSSAYDLSAYEGYAKEKQKKPALKVVQKHSAKRTLLVAFTPKALGCFAIVVTLVCLMIYNNVCLNELSGEINELQSEITRLESEYVRTASELESMISLRVVGERAKEELGMDRLDKYNTKYVYLYKEDKIKLTENAPSPTAAQTAKLAMRAVVDRLMEYIG